MYILTRRLRGTILGLLVLLGPGGAGSQAQVMPGNPAGIGSLTPFGTAHPLANTAVLGRVGLGVGYNLGARTGYGAGAFAGSNAGLGYGSLARSYAGSGLGYGSLNRGLASSALSGAGYGYGLGAGYGGLGTQWMQNPYSGYLSGAASITTSQAQYQQIIQQARLTREEARRSNLQTRRAAIEEAEYERAHMPDPEKIRQNQIQRELDHARVAPPLTEVWSGRSLNALLRYLIAQQLQGARGPNVQLNEDLLKSINLTAGDTRGNGGLLKDNGNLQWPQSLKGEGFKDAREDFSRRLKHAVSTVQLNRSPDESTVNDLQADLQNLNNTVDANVSNLSLDQYTEAKRYLRLLNDAVTALKDRNVADWFNGNRQAKGKTVAELVKFMADKGLWFAPATPSEEQAYVALYHAMAAFDAGMPRSGSIGGSAPPEAGGNAPVGDR